MIDIHGWIITGDQKNCEDCNLPTINEWIGPATGNWDDNSSWSQGTLPDFCDIVIIPPGKTVTRDESSLSKTICNSIEVAVGASLINNTSGTLEVVETNPE